MPGSFILFLLIGLGFLLTTNLLCLIYSIPILFIKRFRNRTNILTFNISLTIMCFSTIHIACSIITVYYKNLLLNNFLCNFLTYIRIMISFQTSFAFITISIHRLTCIVYYSNRFFKTNKWLIICLSTQWILGFLAPLVFLSTNTPDCSYPRWVSIYILIIGIVLSSLICLIVNVRLFLYVYSSSRRMQDHARAACLQSVSTISSTNDTNSHISPRDLRLLLYIIYMFLTYVIGWGPFYILMIISHYKDISGILAGLFGLWAELSLICVVVSLFFCNKDLRKYLRNCICKCF